MKTFRVNIAYSWIYDKTWRQHQDMWLRLNRKRRTFVYPSERKLESYVKRIIPVWKRHEAKVTGEIARISGFDWQDRETYCYVVGWCIPFSVPLTLKPYKRPDDFIDLLTHELIHQIFWQNGGSPRARKLERYIAARYGKERETVKSHIFLHAIHKRLYLELFGAERLERDMKWTESYPDYRRSWQIVEKEGHENLIARLDGM